MEISEHTDADVFLEADRRHKEMRANGQTSLGVTKITQPPPMGEPKPKFAAVCSQCGGPTSVPFKPTPGWKILCTENGCYQKSKGGV